MKKPEPKTKPVVIPGDKWLRDCVNAFADVIQDKLELANIGFESVDIRMKVRLNKAIFDYQTINHAMPKSSRKPVKKKNGK